MKRVLKALLYILLIPFWVVCGILIGIVFGFELGDDLIYGNEKGN